MEKCMHEGRPATHFFVATRRDLTRTFYRCAEHIGVAHAVKKGVGAKVGPIQTLPTAEDIEADSWN